MGTFSGGLSIMAQITLLTDPDAKSTQQEANQVDLPPNHAAVAVPTISDIIGIGLSYIPIPNILPDG